MSVARSNGLSPLCTSLVLSSIGFFFITFASPVYYCRLFWSHFIQTLVNTKRIRKTEGSTWTLNIYALPGLL
ncbi:hypothetical protein F5X99DRAFT_369801 [Biscogniauxia marginata]|nr:hypothetical protein F5X99DRAFT_369801 [Biscogniauxia marginata]